MATPVERRLRPKEVRHFGSGNKAPVFPDLTEIQTRGYAAFLQEESPPDKRKAKVSRPSARDLPHRKLRQADQAGLPPLRVGQASVHARRMPPFRLTYGRPFRIWLRLTKEQPIEEEVYLGDLPIMLGGGEFIINGADESWSASCTAAPASTSSWKRKATTALPSCRIIPERGSWIEINVTERTALTVRIDQSGKFSAMTLLRAMNPKYGRTPI